MMVKHDKKFAVDNSCANLSIKYNMLYISVYQLIQREIENHTEWGQKLTNSKNARDLAEEYRNRMNSWRNNIVQFITRVASFTS